MSDPRNQHWLAIVEQQYGHGQIDAAIETLTRALGEDPDDGEAHAFLAICLLKRKRLYAAALEAQRATELDPESLFAHLASAGVATAQRQFVRAEQHLITAREMYPQADSVYNHFARLYIAWHREDEAIANNLRACELAPGDAGHLALRAWLHWHRGDRQAAVLYAREALEEAPETIEALCVLGHCELADGRVEAAREHAAWALQIDPMSEEALTLLGAIKARQSFVLGLWWRFQAFVSAGSRLRAVMLLIGIYMLYRIAMIAFDENGRDDLLTPLSLAWMGFCIYTWVAPSFFWKSVVRELEQVRLKPGF